MSTIQEIMTALSEGEAAKARVPELEAHLKAMQSNIDALARHNQELELRAKAREAVIADQLSSISKLREERDDASFQGLEAQDKLTTFAKAVGNAWGGIGNALNAVNPPKPEPIVEPVKDQADPLPTGSTQPEPMAGLPKDQSAGPFPFAPSLPTTGNPSETAPYTSVGTEKVASSSDGTQFEGQSEPRPTMDSTASDRKTQEASTVGSSPNAGVSNAEQAGGVASTFDKPWTPSVEMPKVTEDKPTQSEGYSGFSDTGRGSSF